MIAIFNHLPVKDGAADQIVERFAESRGHVQGFPGFVSMEVLVVTRWRDRESFDAWVGSEEFSRAHGHSGAGELLRGHPKMASYEVAVERGPEVLGAG